MSQNDDTPIIFTNQDTQSPIYGWPYDEDEEQVITTSSTGGMSSSFSSIVSEADLDSFHGKSSSQRETTTTAAVEISVRLDHAEEYPSPSSVSLAHSSTVDLSEIGLSIPTLPTHQIEMTRRSCAPVEPTSAILPYNSRRRRRHEQDVGRSCSITCDVDQRLTQLDPTFADDGPGAGRSSSGSNSVGTSSVERQTSRWIFRGIPRFAVMLCAITFVALSVHDAADMVAIQDHRQQLTSSGSRREEVAFPLGRVEASTSPATKVKLPKYYLPKMEASGGGKLRKVATSPQLIETTASKASASKHLHGSNFAMARARQALPIFVPDQPLPGGGFRKPVERFVFDPAEQQRQFQDDPRSGKRNTLSWTSWLASVALVGILLETGWKEYHKCRLLEEEERRL
ncbi:hypothetical protein IV203_007012 [Nitzschia inconspicua]|uniref:Uncharacterized protein n=1 Tax=Nitzschia inconspicua TaxID=303405 RepID=A0A9K3PCH7_9STRA|nr:hypothetical protein IV203_007012 [Nitzschia inconspicua]